MAAENGSSRKGKDRTDEGDARKPGVTLDLEAEARPEAPQAAADAAESETSAGSAAGPEAGVQNQPAAEAPTASGAPTPPISASPEPVRARPGIIAFVIAGVIGGVVAVGLGYGLQLTGVLPAPGETAANEARTESEALKDTASGLDQRLTAIEAASAQAIADRALLDDLSRQVGVVDAFGESLSDRLLQAEAAIAALKEDSSGTNTSDVQQALDALSQRVTRLETVPPPAVGGNAEMQQRLDALSKRVARLEEAPSSAPSTAAPAPASAVSPSPGAGDQAARAAAIAGLQRAAAGSDPFSADLDKVAALGVAPAAIASLRPLAEKGAPSRAQLAAQFPKVADAILATEPTAGAGAGLFDRLTAFGRSLVKVRPAGSQAGGDIEAIVERMRTAVAAGDLAAALAARKALPADGQAASRDWADAVAARLEIDRLTEAIATPPDGDNSSG